MDQTILENVKVIVKRINGQLQEGVIEAVLTNGLVQVSFEDGGNTFLKRVRLENLLQDNQQLQDFLFGDPNSAIYVRHEAPLTPPRVTPASASMGAAPNNENVDLFHLGTALRKLSDQIKKILSSNPPRLFNDDHSEDPSRQPSLFVSNWLDRSDLYGLGYRLSNGLVGVNFNDDSKFLLWPDGKSICYFATSGNYRYDTFNNFPAGLGNKVRMLTEFKRVMMPQETTGGPSPPLGWALTTPNMSTWFKTPRSTVMILSNGSIQINSFTDHGKMILSPQTLTLTTIGAIGSMRTYKLSSLETGLTKTMFCTLQYVLEEVGVVL